MRTIILIEDDLFYFEGHCILNRYIAQDIKENKASFNIKYTTCSISNGSKFTTDKKINYVLFVNANKMLYWFLVDVKALEINVYFLRNDALLSNYII